MQLGFDRSGAPENNFGPDMDRRSVVVNTALTVAASYLTVRALKGLTGNTQGSTGGLPTNPEATNFEQYPPTFADQNAESIAYDLVIDPGTYYTVTAETIEAINEGKAFLDPELSPTLPPAVRDLSDALHYAANESHVPVNLLGVLTTIESGGDVNASSGVALGPIQVAPQYHMQAFIERGYLPADASYADYENAREGNTSNVPLSEYVSAFDNPYKSTVVGADFLAQCIEDVRADNPDMDPNSPVIYALAGGCYNGGATLARESYSEFPEQSELYVNHVIRILMDVEIAGRMRREGFTDDQILNATWSEEMNARAYAYGEVGQTYSMNTITDYDARANAAGAPVPGRNEAGDYTKPYGALVYGSFRDYSMGRANISAPHHRYDIPLAPGLRIWAEGGGSNLLFNMPQNANWRLPR
jgi:hypothetical protein